MGPGPQGWPRSCLALASSVTAANRGGPRPRTIPTLWRVSCFSTMWSLFSMACFSLQSPGLGKNWGRE